MKNTNERVWKRLHVFLDDSMEEYVKELDFITEQLNDKGIRWEGIDIIREDSAKKRERIDAKLTRLYKGVGIYDINGNMSQYMKQTMNYLIRQLAIKYLGMKLHLIIYFHKIVNC